MLLFALFSVQLHTTYLNWNEMLLFALFSVQLHTELLIQLTTYSLFACIQFSYTLLHQYQCHTATAFGVAP
jgi:hypothetical protein